jgi:hypothetical protein
MAALQKSPISGHFCDFAAAFPEPIGGGACTLAAELLD